MGQAGKLGVNGVLVIRIDSICQLDCVLRGSGHDQLTRRPIAFSHGILQEQLCSLHALMSIVVVIVYIFR